MTVWKARAKWVDLLRRLLALGDILSNGLHDGTGKGNTDELGVNDPREGTVDLARKAAKGVLERRQLT